MEMEDQYGMADFRQFTDGRPANFPAIQSTGELFSGHRNLTQAQQYEMVMMGPGRQVGREMVVPPVVLRDQFRSESTTTTTTSTNSTLNGLENMEGGGLGGDGGTGRWPRQETLTLLEIRSNLDSKFKEANQKGPLWDEVSRIMYEEHGYQRSGKKCREKFENLYKYYKKTKDGKAGRQDGKHYRFFRQLEALYGETSNPSSVSDTHLVGNSSFRFHNASTTTTISNQEAFQAPKLTESLSLSSSSEFNSSYSDDNDANNAAALKDIDLTEKRKMRRGKRSWKAKISDFIDAQMRKLMEKQEDWLEKMMKSIERKEEERLMREEEWRKKEAVRIDREHKFWANERAWIEARDAALMEALQKLTGKDLLEAELRSLKDNQNINENGSETITNIVNADHSWPECEITKLMQLRDLMESRFQQSGCIEEILWEEIAAKMAYLGYDRSALMCKDKWDSINSYLRKTTKECNKKRKENSRNCCYFPNHELIYNQGGAYCEINEQEGPQTTRFATNESASPPNSNTGNAMHDSCFRLLMGDGGNLWENYGLKHSKGKNH
ncbi:trihelix transcription factor PTL-like [Cornus florida]|uniref:trihelix transcription factor PTL-like n=1 Tax=Cornus florida TaxID=4283 RepID=UPI0028989167|nr:trihelix transcription factor PTL-like [Cornus florida]